MTRRSNSFGQLIDYILQSKSNYERKSDSFIITQHLRGKTPEAWTDEFIMNENSRLHFRTSPVKMYHSVLSFHSEDTRHITKQMLIDITRKFLRLHGENALSMASAHTDNKNVHIHIIQSAIDKFKKKSIRITRKQFQNIKLEMENYFHEKYPILDRSRINHDKSNNLLSEREFQLVKRTKKESERDQIKRDLFQSLNTITTREQFFQSIRDKGYEIYYRYGKEYGIKGKRKIRFSSLGISETELKYLDLHSEFQQIHKNEKTHRIEIAH